ncbi:MAG TPA: YcaO-like family protein [Alphaproteobacteria bacterium]|nr:YcaO-like family protein [Alphaproteobacteria bacterium]
MISAHLIKTVTRRAHVPAGWIIAKSVMGVRTGKFGPRAVYGFAIDATEEQAIARSQYEVLERVHAYYDVFFHSAGVQESLPSYGWASHLSYGYKLAGEVLLAHPQQAIGVDANGLAWHTTLEEAVAHGMLEVVERHLNARIWYEGAQLCPVSVTPLAIPSLTLNLYTTIDNIPFVLAVIGSSNHDVLACGTSVAATLGQAELKASQEAYMVLDGLLQNDTGNANSETSRAKLLSLREKEFIQPVLGHLNELLVHTPAPPKVIGLKQIMENVTGLNTGEGHYCLLAKGENAVAIRAFCTGALNPKFHPQRGSVPEDPFC